MYGADQLMEVAEATHITLGRKYKNKRLCEIVADSPGDVESWRKTKPKIHQMKVLCAYSKMVGSRRELEEALGGVWFSQTDGNGAL